MPFPLFSDGWAKACAEQINAHPPFLEAGAGWTVTVLLRIDSTEGDARRVHFDLVEGRCRAARAGTEGDEDVVEYVMTGTLTAWEAVLGGRVPPLMALMTGKLSIVRGNLTALLPRAGAARELVAAAALVPVAMEG